MNLESNILRKLHLARAELACRRCGNGRGVMTPLGIDECPDCHGEGRHTATIELLEELARRVQQ